MWFIWLGMGMVVCPAVGATATLPAEVGILHQQKLRGKYQPFAAQLQQNLHGFHGHAPWCAFDRRSHGLSNSHARETLSAKSHNRCDRPLTASAPNRAYIEIVLDRL
jgi:hypothetical protein